MSKIQKNERCDNNRTNIYEFHIFHEFEHYRMNHFRQIEMKQFYNNNRFRQNVDNGENRIIKKSFRIQKRKQCVKINIKFKILSKTNNRMQISIVNIDHDLIERKLIDDLSDLIRKLSIQ